jgi:hypothetical protein
VYLWLHIQSAINMDIIAWIYGCYIVDILTVLKDRLLHVDVVSVLVWRVLSRGGFRAV